MEGYSFIAFIVVFIINLITCGFIVRCFEENNYRYITPYGFLRDKLISDDVNLLGRIIIYILTTPFTFLYTFCAILTFVIINLKFVLFKFISIIYKGFCFLFKKRNKNN